MGHNLDAILKCHWGIEDAKITHFVTRENETYRVQQSGQDYAMKIIRKFYHDKASLLSELDFLAFLAKSDLVVPSPVATLSGDFFAMQDGQFYSLSLWIDGTIMDDFSKDHGVLFYALGENLAKLHLHADRYQPDKNFKRHAWDREGLIGDTPFWGCFWEHPILDRSQKTHFQLFRDYAHKQKECWVQDYGLIHADPVAQNILFLSKGLALIDFDDFGWGYRLFDIATALLKHDHSPYFTLFQQSLQDGYLAHRSLDMDDLEFFMALRAVTYLGWIESRSDLDTDHRRAMRYLDHALHYTAKIMDTA